MRAKKFNISSITISHNDFDSREGFDQALEWLDEFVSIKIENSESITPIFVKTL